MSILTNNILLSKTMAQLFKIRQPLIDNTLLLQHEDVIADATRLVKYHDVANVVKNHGMSRLLNLFEIATLCDEQTELTAIHNQFVTNSNPFTINNVALSAYKMLFMQLYWKQFDIDFLEWRARQDINHFDRALETCLYINQINRKFVRDKNKRYVELKHYHDLLIDKPKRSAMTNVSNPKHEIFTRILENHASDVLSASELVSCSQLFSKLNKRLQIVLLNDLLSSSDVTTFLLRFSQHNRLDTCEIRNLITELVIHRLSKCRVTNFEQATQLDIDAYQSLFN